MQLFLIRLCAVLMLLSLAIGTLAQSQARSSQEQTSTTPPPQRILSPDDDLLGLASKQGNYAHYYLLPSMSYGKDNLAITNTFSGSNLVRKGGEYPLLYQWKLGFSESMPLLRGKSSASYTFQLSNQIYRSDTLLLSIFGTYVRGLVSPSDRFVVGSTANFVLTKQWRMGVNLNWNQVLTATSHRESIPVSFSIVNLLDSKYYLTLGYSPHNVISRSDTLNLGLGIRLKNGIVTPSINSQGRIGVSLQLQLY